MLDGWLLQRVVVLGSRGVLRVLVRTAAAALASAGFEETAPKTARLKGRVETVGDLDVVVCGALTQVGVVIC